MIITSTPTVTAIYYMLWALTSLHYVFRYLLTHTNLLKLGIHNVCLK